MDSGKESELLMSQDSEHPPQALLTLPSPTAGEENQTQNDNGQDGEKSPDIFESVQAGSDPKENEKTQKDSATTVGEDDSAQNKHPMTTRSKVGAIRKVKSHRRRSSLRSVGRSSRSTMLSTASALSDSQLHQLYNTKRIYLEKKTQMDKELIEKRSIQEEQVLQETYRNEEAELQSEWEEILREEKEEQDKRKREEEDRRRKEKEEQEEKEREKEEFTRQQEAKKQAFKRKYQEKQRKAQQEREHIQKRTFRDMEELDNRSRREQLEINMEQSMEFVGRGGPDTVPSIVNSNESHVEQTLVSPISPPHGTQSGTPSSTNLQAPVNVQPPTTVQPTTSTITHQTKRTVSSSNRDTGHSAGMSASSPLLGTEICGPQNGSVTGMKPCMPAVSCVAGRNVLFQAPAVSTPCLLGGTNMTSALNLNSNNSQNVNVISSEIATSITPTFIPNNNQMPVNDLQSSNPNENVCHQTPGNVPVVLVTHDHNLPPLEPPIFSGNSSEIRSFVDSFEKLVCCKTSDQKERLFRLLKYTRGTAHTLVKACEHRGPQCCDIAIKLLMETFGRKLQIAHSCINSVTCGPQLKISEQDSLTEFFAEILSCEGTLKDVNYGSVPILTINQIGSRMPPVWKSGWLSHVDNVLNEQHRELTLGDLALYVQKKAREISNIPSNDGNGPQKVPNPVQLKALKPIKSTFATAVAGNTDSERKCPMCEGNHFLNQCSQYRAMDYDPRREFTRKKNLCFACLEYGHWYKDCKRDKPCKIPGCTRKHTTLLHPPEKKFTEQSVGTKPKNDIQQNVAPQSQSNTKLSAYASPSSEEKVLLNVIPVKVRVGGTNNVVATNCFFDTGSTCSFISDSLMQKLNVKGSKTGLTIRTILDSSEHKQSSVVTNIEMSDFEESQFVPLNPLYSNEQIDVDEANIPTQGDVDQFPEFEHIVIPKIDSEVGILIGKDHTNLHRPLDVIYGPEDYFAMKTIAGWMISCPQVGSSKFASSFFTKIKPPLLCQMCTEVVDSIQNEKEELSPKQKLFIERVDKSIRLRDDGHYEMNLPLIDPDVKMPLNKAQVRSRTMNLKPRFRRDRNFYGLYRTFIQTMIILGFVERVFDLDGPVGKTWYLSHHGVFHPEKGTLRVVHDCSAKFHGICLNDVLLQGPDLANKLTGVLCRYRNEIVAVQGDIKSMFLQVKISEFDRDLCRFFWFKDGDINQPLEEYRMTVFLFGTVCSPTCANLALRKTADDNADDYEASVVSAVYDSFYVDDFLDSKPDATQAIEHVKGVSELVAKGGFEIMKWVSNDRSVLMSIPETHRAKVMKGLDLSVDELPTERALGLIWNVEEDSLCFRVKHKEKPVTRRGLLAIVNSIYDPLGIGQPIIQPMKVLMQNLCRLQLDWDDQIPPELEFEWTKWLSDLPKLREFSVPRCYVPVGFGEVTEVQLHHFSDASEKAYGAVSYLRSTNSSGEFHCAIVCGKTRLVPLNGSTIPRLELSAATISAHNDKFFRKELKLPIKESHFWTDSTTVLRYLANTDRVFKTYVQNRVNVIKESSEIDQWHYVPSKSNPADVASRGLSVESFLECHQWKFGPDFLWQSSNNWPEQPEFLHASSDSVS